MQNAESQKQRKFEKKMTHKEVKKNATDVNENITLEMQQ